MEDRSPVGRRIDGVFVGEHKEGPRGKGTHKHIHGGKDHPQPRYIIPQVFSQVPKSTHNGLEDLGKAFEQVLNSLTRSTTEVTQPLSQLVPSPPSTRLDLALETHDSKTTAEQALT